LFVLTLKELNTILMFAKTVSLKRSIKNLPLRKHFQDLSKNKKFMFE